MKIRVWYQISDGGDGSASAIFFPTEEAAMNAAQEEFDHYGQGFLEDGVGYQDIETDDYEKVE